MSKEKRGIWFDQPIKYKFLRKPHGDVMMGLGSSTNQKSSFGWNRLKQYPFSEKQKCRLVVSLHVFLENIWKTRDWNGEFDSPVDALSTPSSFHCCLSQVSVACTCLSSLLSFVLLELCSSGLPPNLVKREIASTPTLSLDFLRKQSNTWLESECLIQTTNEKMTLTS